MSVFIATPPNEQPLAPAAERHQHVDGITWARLHRHGKIRRGQRATVNDAEDEEPAANCSDAAAAIVASAVRTGSGGRPRRQRSAWRNPGGTRARCMEPEWPSH